MDMPEELQALLRNLCLDRQEIDTRLAFLDWNPADAERMQPFIMTAEGHIIFAIASAIFAKRAELTPVLASADWWHLVPAALLTCLLPDIDHPKSVLGQRLRWIAIPISRAFGHRGFTHSLLAIAGGMALFQLDVPRSWPIPPDVLHLIVGVQAAQYAAAMSKPAA